MKKRISFIFILLSSTILLSGCSMTNYVANLTSEDTTSKEYSVVATLFHQPYIDASGVATHCASERKAAISKVEKVISGEKYSIGTESKFLQGTHYAITNNSSRLCYYGDIKKNRPDGFGIIMDGEQYIYIGYFSKGKYQGYGAEFTARDSSGSAYASILKEDSKFDGISEETLAAYLENHVVYDGEWKKGKKSGKGNSYDMKPADIEQFPALENYWGVSCYPYLTVCEYKKDKMSGDAKRYVGQQLLYDGKLKDGEQSGEGTSYYSNGQKKYKGSWRAGEYDGKGTLYDENGKTLYSGKWDRGDYAS